MIVGIALLIWGIGITLLAFSVQTQIQEGTDPEWQKARGLYDNAPITFCVIMFVMLSLWPMILVYLIYKNFSKGVKHGN